MRSILLALSLIFVLSGCGEADHTPTASTTPASEEAIPFRHDGELEFLRDDQTVTDIAIEIADTDEARTRGLMQRESLPTRSGMLFIFDDEAPRSFWMANTPLALDIMFVSADSQIVTIQKYTRPFSPQSVASTAPARFVVEVPAGFSDSHGILESDRIRWIRND